MFQRSVSTFSRMFCSHVGVSDHSATLSVPRCQAIDLYTGALTDLRCITTKCKCKSSLFPSLSSSSLFLAARVTSESAREIKTTGRKQQCIERKLQQLLANRKTREFYARFVRVSYLIHR